MLLLVASALALEPLDLTPTAGVEDCEDEPDFVQKGYAFTVEKAFTFYAVEWLVELPEGATAYWQLTDWEGYGHGRGEALEGDGVLDWRRSWTEGEVAHPLSKGDWHIAFVHTAPETARYCRRVGAGAGPFELLPHLSGILSVSATHENHTPNTENRSPPYIRFVLDPPDRDEDGVGDAEDNCPDEANGEQLDSDGDGKGDACDRCWGRDSSGDGDGDEHCWKLEDDTIWDCDDEDTSIHPAATDLCGDGVDQDCSGSDEPCPDSGRDSEAPADSPSDSPAQDSEAPARTPEVDEEPACGCTTGSAGLLILGLLLASARRRAGYPR